MSTESHCGFSTETLVVTEDSTSLPESVRHLPGAPIPILLFAKFPLPGRVKTRVARTIGETDATRLASALLYDSVTRFSAIEGAPLWLFGDTSTFDPFRPIVGREISYRDQGEGSLGDRLRRAFADPPEGAAGVIAIGADAPHLDPAVLAEAAAVVRSGRAALGPAQDGGFYLIGVPCGAFDLGALFPETGWGEAEVLAHTRKVLGKPLRGAFSSGEVPASQGEAAASSGEGVPQAGERSTAGPGIPPWHEFPPVRDIDEWSDVVELARLILPDRGEDPCPLPSELLRTAPLVAELLARFGPLDPGEGAPGRAEADSPEGA